MNHYAIITIEENRVLDVFTSEHDAGHYSVVEEGSRRAESEGAVWVYVEQPCKVGDFLNVDDDGCATVRGVRLPAGARVESLGAGEDDERGCVRANLPGGMVEVGWDQGSVSTMHSSGLRLI